MFVLDTFAVPQLFVFGQFYALEKQACFYFLFSKLFVIILSCVLAFADVCDYRKHFFPKYTHSFLFICGIIFFMFSHSPLRAKGTSTILCLSSEAGR